MTDLEELKSYRDQIKSAERNLEAFIKRRWPEGSPIIWVKHGHLQYGEVIHSGIGSVRVRNDHTGKSYWVDIYWVEQALELKEPHR